MTVLPCSIAVSLHATRVISKPAAHCNHNFQANLEYRRVNRADQVFEGEEGPGEGMTISRPAVWQAEVRLKMM